jgi:hypothetical protein
VAARAAYEAAIADGGPAVPVDPRASLASLLLQTSQPPCSAHRGDAQAARADGALAEQLLEELQESGSTHPFLYELIGSCLEDHRGDLAAACDWYSTGITRCAPPAEPAALVEVAGSLVVVERARVRRLLGLEPDDVDQALERYRADPEAFRRPPDGA